MTSTHKLLAGLTLFVIMVLSAVIFAAMWKPQDIRAGEGGPFADSCTVNTVTSKAVGTASTRIFATSTGPANRRAWIRIQQPMNATNTIAIVMNQDVAATITSGILLPPATTTATLPGHIELGLNTNIPYTGSITAIAGTGGAVVNVTECLYP